MKTTVSMIGLGALLATMSIAAPAHAIPRTFVSGTGSGSTCTRAAPCATFQLAHDATDAGGEVNCLNDGDFGTLTITKSVTIDCTGTNASITTTGVGVTIDTVGITVHMRNVGIQGFSTTSGPGILYTRGTALYVEK